VLVTPVWERRALPFSGYDRPMKNLIVAVALVGCSSNNNNVTVDACTTCSTAHVGATWKLKNVAGTTQACPSGFDTAALVNQPIDSSGNNAGAAIIDLFTCSDGAGTSAALPATKYKTWVQITDHTGGTVYAKSVPATLDVTTVDLTYNADILTDGGYFSLAWILRGAVSNNQLTCAQAGVTGSSSGVETTATLATSTNASTDQFTCDDGSGVTSGLVAGTYTVSVDAFTTAGAVGTAPTLTNQTITAPNNVTSLGTITIPITGM
jgi:hypothetical protein